MPASDFVGLPGAVVDPAHSLRVDCYVRSSVPGPIAETIDTVVDRLEHLSEHDRITEYEATCWPPERDAITEAVDAWERTRAELVAEFERWADRNGYSLDPGFRRVEVPSSPSGLGTGEPRERIRVPIVALAIRDVDDVEADANALRGVVPCSDSPGDDARTYTVDEWLSAIETRGEAKPFPHDGARVTEGQR